jgi:hypothetical protein
MLRCTNQELSKGNKKETTKGEILAFFGVMILITKFEFSSRATLWSTTVPRKYLPAAAFGKTGMSRNRFDDLLRYMLWNEQPEVRPNSMSSEKYRWSLVDGFVDRFNEHRASMFIPSEHICVDESISRWY